MNVDARIAARFEELIARGETLLLTRKRPPPNHIGFDSRVDSQVGNQWRASVQNLLARTLGEESEHYRLFSAQFNKGLTFSPVKRGLGILAAAREDYEGGFVVELRELVAAEIFADLLHQAEELLEAGYKGPAAVLAGAVLEDELRKLCVAKSVDLPDKPKLDLMNAKLAKIGLFSKLTQKRLTAVAEIRNLAAHGKWEEFSPEDVSEMIGQVTAFLEKHSG